MKSYVDALEPGVPSLNSSYVYMQGLPFVAITIDNK